MKLILNDIVTGTPYEVQVINGKLTMRDTSDDGAIAAKLTDLLTNKSYDVKVVDGKLVMTDSEQQDVVSDRTNLIDYLPTFIQGYYEIKVIMDSEQESFNEVWLNAENVLANQFAEDATEEGVLRYEKILGITPKGTSTLDERKFGILTKINGQLPYTMESVEKSLTSLCGADGYTMELDANNYKLHVKLDLSNESNFNAVCDMLNAMLPANIERNVILYNTNEQLSLYTYGELSAYTYDGLRKELI